LYLEALVNIQKQIDYWVNGSNEDLISAELLINGNRLLHGLFWYHLFIEKAIKAYIVKHTLTIPPRSHNLIWLLEKTSISINQDQEALIGVLMVYQLEGRYPENFPLPPLRSEAIRILEETKKLHQWLTNKL
jgi:HEPN domain-containing protein